MSDDYSSIIDGFFADASQRAAASVFEDPKKIARSYELGKATGVHPQAIYGDVEGFEQRLQARTAAEIIEGSPELAAWINGDPLRGGLASGDLVNLDFGLSKLGTYTKEVGKRVGIGLAESAIATPLRGFGAIGLGLREDPIGTLGAISSDIQKATPAGLAIELTKRMILGPRRGPEVTGDVTKEPFYKAGEAVSAFTKHLLGPTDVLHPIVRDLATGAGSLGATVGLSLIPGVGRGLAMGSAIGSGMGEAAERAVKAGATPEQVVRATSLGTYAGATDFADIALLQFGGSTGKTLGLLGKIGMRALMGAFIEGGQEGLQQLIQNAIAKGVYKPDQDLLEDVPYNMFLGAIIGSGARVGLGAAQDWEARRQIKSAEVFAKSGEEPPVGLGTLIDDIKEKKLRADLAALEETQRAFDQSELKATAPDQLVELINNKVGGAENAFVRVSSEAILKLYGTKALTLDDGLLGFTPSLVEQLRIAAVAGGDISIPLADWLGRVDSAVYRELKEDIRTQEAGFTLREVGALKERKKQVEVSEMADLPSKLELKKNLSSEIESSLDQGVTHNFTIQDEKGRSVGELVLTELNDGKHLHVDWVGGAKHLTEGIMGGQRTDWVLGPHLMLQLAKQVREMFPNAEEVSGYRVSGARDKAGTIKAITRKFDLQSDDAMIDFVGDLAWPKLVDELRRVYGLETPIGGAIEQVGPYEMFTPHRWTPEQIRAIESAEEIINRITERKLKVDPVGEIKAGERSARGVFSRHAEIAPIVYLAIDPSKNVPFTARHEAGHFLRKYGFWNEQEWATLSETAEREGWTKRPRFEGHTETVEDLYADKPRELQIEEAIVDEFAAWAEKRDQTHPLAALFQKLLDFLTEIKIAMKEAIGRDLTVEEIFLQAETGKTAQREDISPLDLPGGGKPYMGEEFSSAMRIRRAGQAAEPTAQVEPPKTEESSAPKGVERSVWHKALQGLPKAQIERYMRLMERKNKEDYDWELAKAQREEKRRQTEEWKYQETLAATQAKEEVENSSGITLLRMLRDGVYRGEKMPRLRLDEAALTPEQKAELPKDYYRPRGENPADLAQLFGYPDGQTMVDDLVRLEKKRGVGRFENFIQREIDQRTEELMKEAFGDLEENILQEAKDRVVGVTQADILWEDMIAMAIHANTQMPYTQKDVDTWAAEKFAALPVKLGKVDNYLREVGRAYKTMEAAFLKGDVQAAFIQSERRVFNHAMAKEAKAFEKKVARLDKLIDRFQQRQVKGVNQQYTNFIHQIMLEAGYPVRSRDMADVRTEIAKGDEATLQQFTDVRIAAGFELYVDSEIAEGNIKPVAQMSVQEFERFSDTLTSLAQIGRAEERLIIAGREYEYQTWKEEVLPNIKSLPFQAIQKHLALIERMKATTGRSLQEVDANITRMEEIIKDLDLRRELGPLFKALIVPMMEGKHKSYQLQEELVKKMEAIKTGFGSQWQKSLDDQVPQDFFYDPQYDEQPNGPMLYDLTKNDLIRIALNFGNKSNIKKFTEGYVGKEGALVLETQLLNLMYNHLTKEDWQFIQHIWDMFGAWQADIETMYHNLSGISPKMIEAQSIVTPHGTFKGGYFPLIRDHLRSDPIKGEENPNALFGPGYQRSMPANYHTHERTGARYRVDFRQPLEVVASKMHQTIHDIAYRPAVIQAHKIVNDSDIIRAIERHYGEPYAEQMKYWVKDIANHFNMDDKKMAIWAKGLRAMRGNLTVHALGFNLNILASPAFGMYLHRALFDVPVRAIWDFDGKKALAWEHSKEIPHTYRNLDRDFRERLERFVVENKWDAFRATAARWAFSLMAGADQQFRYLTFSAKFMKAKEEGRTDAEAATIADMYVRQHHGSTGIPDLPAVMRGGEFQKSLTIFYGFFNSMWNWLRQIPGQVAAGQWAEASKTMYGAYITTAFMGALLFNQAKEDDSWFKRAAKALFLGLTSFFPFAREVGTYSMEGYLPNTPLGSIMKAVGGAGKDVITAIQGKKRVEKPIKHTADVIGLLSSLPLGQVGKTSQFMFDVARGNPKQQPRNIIEWVRGLWTGEARLKRSGQR